MPDWANVRRKRHLIRTPGHEVPDRRQFSRIASHLRLLGAHTDVYREVGIELPRRAITQSRVGDRARRLQRGDLLFFSTDTRRSLVTHVGIYEGAGKMIEASKSHGRVRRVSLNDDYFVERFMFARRITGRDDTRTVPVSGEMPPRRESGRARTARRVLGHIAEVLLRRR